MSLRVCLLSHHWPLREGDWKAPFVVERAHALAKRLDVTVVHAVPWMQGLPDDAEGPVKVRRARFLYVPGIGKRFDGRLLARCVRDEVQSARPDIVEAQFGYPDGEAAVAVARELGCASAVVLRGTEQILAKSPARRARMSAALVAADVVLPVSRTLGALARSLGVPADRIHVVENGIDAKVFHPGDAAAARAALGLPASGRLLLGVGHFLPAKGYAEAIDALGRLAKDHPDLRLVLVGAGPEDAALREAAARHGVADRVIWPGIQPHDRVADFMRAADLFVHPSHSEGRPNAVLEAQACGLAAVATDVGGTSEIVDDGVTGFLTAPRDAARLAARIADALASPFDGAAVSQRGLARTWGDTARALENVYAEVVARRTGSAVGAP